MRWEGAVTTHEGFVKGENLGIIVADMILLGDKIEPDEVWRIPGGIWPGKLPAKAGVMFTVEVTDSHFDLELRPTHQWTVGEIADIHREAKELGKALGINYE